MAAKRRCVCGSMIQLSVEEGLDYQTQHVAIWKMVLKPEVVEKLEAWLAVENARPVPYLCGHAVPRGGTIDSWVINKATDMWYGKH